MYDVHHSFVFLFVILNVAFPSSEFAFQCGFSMLHSFKHMDRYFLSFLFKITKHTLPCSIIHPFIYQSTSLLKEDLEGKLVVISGEHACRLVLDRIIKARQEHGCKRERERESVCVCVCVCVCVLGVGLVGCLFVVLGGKCVYLSACFSSFSFCQR